MEPHVNRQLDGANNLRDALVIAIGYPPFGRLSEERDFGSRW
jgi:hypothetical protein